MSFQLPSSRRHLHSRPAWSGAAFIVEAILLLAFLIGSLAVFTQMFALSMQKSAESQTLSQAVALASSTAERFAADPADAQGTELRDGLRVECQVTPEMTDTGTLYRAEIAVYDETDGAASAGGVAGAANEPIYSISTARYESEADR